MRLSHIVPCAFVLALSAVAAAPLAGCSSSAGNPTRGPLEATAGLVPFALQFVGTYRDAAATAAPAGTVTALDLRRDGTFSATVAGSAAPETGTFAAAAVTALPLILIFTASSGATWSAEVTDYDGNLQVTDAGRTSTFAADGTVGPSETLCDATGGSWRDTDADEATGLYCVCPAPKLYLPSAGGCAN
jgi:hypothetical protein